MILKDLLKVLHTKRYPVPFPTAKGWKTANDDALKNLLKNLVDKRVIKVVLKNRRVSAAPFKDSVIEKVAFYYGILQQSWKNNEDLAYAEHVISKKLDGLGYYSYTSSK
jgi:hypothetical protein